MRIQFPIFGLSVCMVSSTAGEAAREVPLERETVETGDLVAWREAAKSL